jgi:adenylate cyclase
MGPGAIHLLLGDKDQGFDWLQKAFEDRSPGLLFLKIDPAFDAVRNDPRVQDLMNRIGLK